MELWDLFASPSIVVENNVNSHKQGKVRAIQWHRLIIIGMAARGCMALPEIHGPQASERVRGKAFFGESNF